MNYRDIARVFSTRFRRRRLQNFAAVFPPAACRRIVDIGGRADIWETLDYPAEITLVNLDRTMLSCPPPKNGRRYFPIVGDGRRLRYSDRSFDLAFANSVIEHVGGPEDAAALATEMQRVGKAFYCQTPSKWFPVEPHVGTLFLHWIPDLLNCYAVLRYCTLWGLIHKPNRTQARLVVDDIRLLGKKELQQLFPGAEIETERFLFWPKSYVALRRPADFGTDKATKDYDDMGRRSAA